MYIMYNVQCTLYIPLHLIIVLIASASHLIRLRSVPMSILNRCFKWYNGISQGGIALVQCESLEFSGARHWKQCIWHLQHLHALRYYLHWPKFIFRSFSNMAKSHHQSICLANQLMTDWIASFKQYLAPSHYLTTTAHWHHCCHLVFWTRSLSTKTFTDTDLCCLA